MAYALRRGRGISRETRRLFDHQIARAVDILSTCPGEVAAARRRVKKARAALLLMRAALGSRYDTANRRLRKVNHLLGSFTDAAVVVEMLDRLQGYDPRRLPASAIDRLRRTFVARDRRLHDAEELHWACARAVRLLNKQREQFANVGTLPLGVHAAAAAIRRAHRDARAARRDAIERPSPSHFHVWRRRTKVEWYLLRLIDREVGGRMADDTRRLEQLGGVLGTLHDTIVLQRHIADCSRLSRRDTANALRVARAYARDVERRLWRHLDAQDEPPAELEARLLSLWLSGAPLADDPEDMPWPMRA